MMPMPELDLLIRGGTVVTPWGAVTADVGVANGRIHDIAVAPSGIAARATVSAEGQLVLPGGVDPHVHFENPSMGTVTTHDFGLGTEAAALGGTTCVIDFAFQAPGETPLETIKRRREIADPKVVIDYGLHGCITRTDERSLADLPAMIEYGCPSTKVFMVYRQEGWMVDSGHLLDLMRRMAAQGGTLLIHAENEELLEWGIADQVGKGQMSAFGHARSRPDVVEVEAIRRGIYFSRETRCQLFVVHMSTAGGVAAVREGQRAGAPVTAETCAHYLVLDESYLARPDGHRYVMSPPLRPRAEQATLWEGLRDGTIAGVGSDDATYFEKDKIRGRDDFRQIANGIPGVQVRLPMIYSQGVRGGRLTLERFVDAVSTQPAKLFGLYPRKGVLAPGSDADIVIFDPDVAWRPTVNEMHTNIEYTCYEDFELTGRPRDVWSRGVQVVRAGELTGRRGHGQFIARPRVSWAESERS
jgi:dihydropyrimidinase